MVFLPHTNPVLLFTGTVLWYYHRAWVTCAKTLWNVKQGRHFYVRWNQRPRKIISDLFFTKNIDSFLTSISAVVSGKIAHTGKKKKRNCATITSFSTVYTLIGYGSRPISALAVSTKPIACQFVRARETSFAIQWMAIYPVIPLFNVWITELWLLKIWCTSYRESNKARKERQVPTLGVRLT